MPFPSLSPRTRRTVAVLALLPPVLALCAIGGAALWVRGHGGLAASLTRLARQAAFVAAGAERLPATLGLAQAATLDAHAPAAGWVWVAGGDPGERAFSFALIEPGKGSTVCLDTDARSGGFRRLQRSATTTTLWFADDGVEYVVTDRATVERARTICEPLVTIGEEMGRVGAKQGEIGAKLGRQGGRLGALGGRLGSLSARLATADLARPDRARLEAELDEVRVEMERVGAEMENASAGMDGDRDALSSRMKALSKRHKEALATARAELRKLLDEVRARGRADKLEGSI
jgi:hypothetical protein